MIFDFPVCLMLWETTNTLAKMRHVNFRYSQALCIEDVLISEICAAGVANLFLLLLLLSIAPR